LPGLRWWWPHAHVRAADRGEGKGIFVATEYAEIQSKTTASRSNFIVQRLLKPHLIGGKKYDLRTYVLVSQFQPLQCHFYHEGIVRFAANEYESKGKEDGRSRWMTNTYFNKKFASVDDLTWTFKRLMDTLAADGVDTNQLMANMKSAIVSTLLTMEPAAMNHLRNEIKTPCDGCYQLLGVDVMLGHDLTAKVIEINGIPSMQLGQKQGGLKAGAAISAYTQLKINVTQDVVAVVTATHVERAVQ